MRRLIAGWKEDKIKSPVAFAKLIGFSLMMLGLGIAILSFFVFFQKISESVLVTLLWLLVSVPMIAAVYGNIKYGK